MKYNLTLILIGCAFFVSCDGSINSPQKKGGQKSESFKLVVENIDSMGNKPWNKTIYQNIKDNQIPVLKRETERTSASEHLRVTYGKVLVTDATKSLNDGCTTYSHEYLNKIFVELKGFSETPGYSDAVKLKQIHDDAMTFANRGVSRQIVNSYRDNYDTSYESVNIQKANSYLSNPEVKCKSTREKLNRLTNNSTYYGRRKSYCESIVNSYLNCTNPANRELNAALGKLNKYWIYKGDSIIKKEWEKKMKEHHKFIQLQKKAI